jgi:hypothetical protein
MPQELLKAGFNCRLISAGFSSWMIGQSALKVAVEFGLEGVIAGAEESPFQ